MGWEYLPKYCQVHYHQQVSTEVWGEGEITANHNWGRSVESCQRAAAESLAAQFPEPSQRVSWLLYFFLHWLNIIKKKEALLPVLKTQHNSSSCLDLGDKGKWHRRLLLLLAVRMLSELLQDCGQPQTSPQQTARGCRDAWGPRGSC